MEMNNGIFIDLGHGGTDSGAVGLRYTESMLVLEIGNELKNLLEKSNVKYKFSRLSDVYLTLERRCELANNMNADLFLSIHINSAKDCNAIGTESWVYSLKNNKTTIDFATSLTNDLVNLLNTDNRGIKENKKFNILRGTRMGALILEVDFISNSRQEQVIKANIKAIARTLYINILKLYNIPIPEEENLYKVCIGSFVNKENAIKLREEAIAKGFNNTRIF